MDAKEHRKRIKRIVEGPNRSILDVESRFIGHPRKLRQVRMFKISPAPPPSGIPSRATASDAPVQGPIPAPAGATSSAPDGGPHPRWENTLLRGFRELALCAVKDINLKHPYAAAKLISMYLSHERGNIEISEQTLAKIFKRIQLLPADPWS